MSSKLIDTNKAENFKKIQSLVPLAKIVAVITLLLITLGLIGVDGHYLSYYNKWVECSERPIGARGSGFYNAGVPYYEQVKLFRPFYSHISYFCNPIQAEQHGYSADSQTYIFPNIKAKYGQVCRLETDPVSETAYEFVLCSER